MTPEQVAAAIVALPRALRKAFVMRFVLHLPRAEIALALGISPRRVDRRIERALRRCGGRLG